MISGDNVKDQEVKTAFKSIQMASARNQWLQVLLVGFKCAPSANSKPSRPCRMEEARGLLRRFPFNLLYVCVSVQLKLSQTSIAARKHASETPRHKDHGRRSTKTSLAN